MAERIIYPVMAAMTMVGVLLGICDLGPSDPTLPRSKKRANRPIKPAETNTHAYETQAHAW